MKHCFMFCLIAQNFSISDYIWCHKNILHCIHNSAKCALEASHTKDYICNTDMPSVYHTNYTTVPVECSPTSVITDITCILFKYTHKLIIFEPVCAINIFSNQKKLDFAHNSGQGTYKCTGTLTSPNEILLDWCLGLVAKDTDC